MEHLCVSSLSRWFSIGKPYQISVRGVSRATEYYLCFSKASFLYEQWGVVSYEVLRISQYLCGIEKWNGFRLFSWNRMQWLGLRNVSELSSCNKLHLVDWDDIFFFFFLQQLSVYLSKITKPETRRTVKFKQFLPKIL